MAQLLKLETYKSLFVDFFLNRDKWIMMKEFVAELIAQFFFMTFGQGGIAVYVLDKSRTGDVDSFSMGFSFGIGFLIAFVIASPLSGCHLNPAFTVALAILKKFSWEKVPHYVFGQYLGSFLASVVIFATYYEAIDAFDGGKRSAYGNVSSTGHIFTTFPQPHVSIYGVFLDQLVVSSLLCYSILAIQDENGINTPKSLQPITLALLITAICVAFGFNCNIFLPTRDFPPRVFISLAGYGRDAFRPLYWNYWWVGGLLAPHLGALLGCWLYYITVGHFYSGNFRSENIMSRTTQIPDNRIRPSTTTSTIHYIESINEDKMQNIAANIRSPAMSEIPIVETG